MEKESQDLISSLPHDVLRRIVSFLPLEQAVRTSVLSTVWRRLWLPLEIVTSHEATNGEINEIIRMLLNSSDSPQVWKLILGFRDSEQETRERRREVVTVLATKGVEKELHLEFSQATSKTIMSYFQLKLEKMTMQAAKIPSTLRTLHLRSVNDVHGKDLISALFSSCQFLESLSLENCRGLESLDLDANDCLRNLKVVDCPDIVNIRVSATNLRTFWYHGVLPHVQLQNTLDLVEVGLDLKNGLGRREFDCEEVLSLLASVKEIEVLTVNGWLLECLCSAGVIFERLEFKFNRLEELSWIDSAINKPKRDSLACFLNICPSLEKLLIKIDPSRESLPCPYFHHYWHEPHLWMDCCTALESNGSKLERLKMVTLLGYAKEEDQLLLKDLLVKKAILLKSIISPGQELWRIAKIDDNQLKQQTWRMSSLRKQNAVLSLIKDYFWALLGKNISSVLYSGKTGLCDHSFWF